MAGSTLILGEAQARRSTEEPVIFELTRVNCWAVATAWRAYQWGLANGAGTRFALSG